MTSALESPSLFDCLKPSWLGLSTDNRRLFDALQDGWLRPLQSDPGLLVGVGAYARDESAVQISHRIPVRIRLNVAKLPALEVAVFRRGEWMRSNLGQVALSDATLLSWPGVLPTFAISELAVSTEEERTRLIGLARHFSNIDMPDVPIAVRVGDDEVDRPPTAPPPTACWLTIPPHEDAIRGAMNMAFWAVPRIDPWLAILTESLSFDHTRLPDLADDVNASWWQFPPWAQFSGEAKPSGLQDCLWLATVEIFSTHPVNRGLRVRELADEIASGTLRYGGSAYKNETATWLQSTHRILRAESTIQPDRWRSCPVGMAIQLVLTRPEPSAFKTWFKDRPDLPPAVAWSAAVLCGLYNGFKRLDTEFRGGAPQREVVAIRALGACSETLGDIRWPGHVDDKPSWRKEGHDFVLSWDGVDFARKRVRERGQWYVANFEDMGIRREAGTVVRKLGWQCFVREITLTDVRVQYSGPGIVSAKRGSPKITVRGKIHFQLPADAEVEEVVHIDSFRRLIATEFGRIPAPPIPRIPDKRCDLTGIPGLTYVQEFLSEDEETRIIEEIDRCDWSAELQRRVQHYGWRYDYKAGQVDPAMRLGPLPPWAENVARRLVERGLVPKLPDQVIVNEYVGNQGIARHVDSKESFEDGIAMVSMLESWEMVFRERRDKRKLNQMLEQRSVAIIKGDARYLWTHEIPKRKTEPSTVLKPSGKKPTRVPRKRRVSLTFRKVIDNLE